MPRPNEIATELREIVGNAEAGSRCNYCGLPHELISRPGKHADRLGFKVTTHSRNCLIGQLRGILQIADEDFA